MARFPRIFVFLFIVIFSVVTLPACGQDGGGGSDPPPDRNSPPSSVTECDDGVDNDGDTLVDLEDPDCGDAADTTETPQSVAAAELIAFASDTDGDFEIYTMNFDGSGLQKLTDNDVHDKYPNWSPGGGKIAFQSLRNGDWEIYVMNPDGSAPVNLTKDSETQDVNPVFSPDGSQIAFVKQYNASIEWGWWVMNADGSGKSEIYHYSKNAGDTGNPADWLDDTTIIAEYGPAGGRQIYRIGSDGAGMSALTASSGQNRYPVLSPDKTKILFWSDRDGAGNFWTMNPDGTNQAKLTSGGFTVTSLGYLPDGSGIVYNKVVNAIDTDIWVMNPDGSGAAALYDDGGKAADVDLCCPPN